MMDGGHVRALAKQARKPYTPDYIEKIAAACVLPNETPLRILYYDCAPFSGHLRLPISGDIKEYRAEDGWLRQLAHKDLFAVRLGVLKPRGFERKVPLSQPQPLTDDDFKPVFEQKGVDMRIGLDMAVYSSNRAAERIILLTNDSDCIPAMKHARRAGLQIVLVQHATRKANPDLKDHADFTRLVPWPEP